jgi:Protein of unknown function (DUF3040)
MRALTQARTRARVQAQEHVMSLDYHQQRQLHRIESRLLRSDPQLAAKLAMFGRLSAGQRMPGREQAATRLDRIRQAAALIAKAAAAMSAAIDLLVSALLALLTALIMGSRAQPAQPARQRTNPGTNGR